MIASDPRTKPDRSEPTGRAGGYGVRVALANDGWSRAPGLQRLMGRSAPRCSRRTRCGAADVWLGQHVLDHDRSDVPAIGTQLTAGSAVVAVGSPFGTRPARAGDQSQLKASTGDKRLELRGRAVAEFALAGAVRAAAGLGSIEADQVDGVAPRPNGVAIDDGDLKRIDGVRIVGRSRDVDACACCPLIADKPLISKDPGCRQTRNDDDCYPDSPQAPPGAQLGYVRSHARIVMYCTATRQSDFRDRSRLAIRRVAI